MQRVLSARWLITAISAVLFPTVSAQLRQLPGDLDLGSVQNNQLSPHISAGADHSLAVWADNRANPYSFYEYETSWDIYGTRLTSNGVAMEATPFPIYAGPAAQENPKASWNGRYWLVVFEDTRLGGTGYYYQKGLAAVRVSPEGEVLDANPIPLHGLQASGPWYWDVASDGNGWVVACQGTSASNGIVVMRVSDSGRVLDPPNRLVVQPTYYERSNLQLAYANGTFLLTFNDNYVNGRYITAFVRFDRSLLLLDAFPRFLVDWPLGDLASSGSQFYGVWPHQRPDYLVRVYGTRIDTSGQKLDGAGVEISTGEPNDWMMQVAWDGLGWITIWGEFNTLRMAKINANGTVQNPGGVQVPGVKSGPAAPTSDRGLNVVWSEYFGSNTEVFGAHIFPTGSSSGAFTVSVGVPAQTGFDAAASGSGYMVVYKSATNQSVRVLAQPLYFNGDPIGGPVELDTGAAVSGPTRPHVAWTGDFYFVSWGKGSTVYAQRLWPDGTKVDPTPFVVMASPYFGPSDVAVIGDTALVLGRRSFQNGQIIKVFASRVRVSDGVVLDSTPLDLGGIYVARQPLVVALGGRFLVAYISNATHDNPAALTTGIFVPTAGSAGTAFGIHSFMTSGGNGIHDLGLASNGTKALLAQSEEITSGVETDLLYRFIDANGSVSPRVNLTPWQGNQYRPAVAWDGRYFVITYQEQKNRQALHTLDQLDARGDLFGMRIAADGSVLDPMGFVFSAEQFGETDPAVVALDGRALFVGALMDNSEGKANYRGSYGFIGSSANIWPVAVAVASPAFGDVPLTVSFSSAGSYDPDGSLANYRWDFGDNTTSLEQNPIHVFTSGVPHIVKLTVTDNLGASTTQAILVWASKANQLPVAIGVGVPHHGSAPLNAVFYADGSFDPDGFIGNIEWTFGNDGSVYWGSPAYQTFNASGLWPVDLRVYDSRNAIGSTRIYVAVGRTESKTPTTVQTSLGRYLDGDPTSLATSDDRYYTIESRPPLTPTGPSAQLDATFVLSEAAMQAFAIRVEGSVTAFPPENIRQRVLAFDWQSSQWVQLDERVCTSFDLPYEVAQLSNAGRFVEPTTKEVKIRLSWAGTSSLLIWRANTDHLRLTVLKP